MGVFTLHGRPAIIDAIEGLVAPRTIAGIDSELFGALLVREAPSLEGVILIERASLQRALGVEYLAWSLAEHQRVGACTVTVTDRTLRTPLCLGDGTVLAILGLDGAVGAIGTDDERAVEAVSKHLSTVREHSTTMSVSAGPSRGLVLDTFADHIGSMAAGRYHRCLQATWPNQLDGRSLDALAIAVLVVAAHGGWLFDLREWVATAGIGSSADVSRRKRRLERAGLIQAAEITRGVGRPRQRLELVAEAMQEANRPDLAILAPLLLDTH